MTDERRGMKLFDARLEITDNGVVVLTKLAEARWWSRFRRRPSRQLTTACEWGATEISGTLPILMPSDLMNSLQTQVGTTATEGVRLAGVAEEPSCRQLELPLSL
jgi:hypothetical protein